MRRICYRCARNPGAVAKRSAGFKTIRQKYVAAFAFDRTPGRTAYTYTLFLFRQKDLQHAESYLVDKPAKGQFELFENFYKEYQEDSGNGFGVSKITAG